MAATVPGIPQSVSRSVFVVQIFAQLPLLPNATNHQSGGFRHGHRITPPT